MEILLRLKHWQIFMLTFGIVIVAAVIQGIAVVISPYDTVMERVTVLLGVFITVAWCLWAYIAGIKLSEKRPHDNFNSWLFKWSLIVMGGWSVVETLLFPILNITLGELRLLYTLITLAAGVYADYALAKALTSVEGNRETTFSDFAGDFFLFLFYPIGVWWLQPRINRIFVNAEDMVDPDAPLDHNLNG